MSLLMYNVRNNLTTLLVNTVHLFNLDPVVITSISLASLSLPRDSEVTIKCTFDGNPPPENVTWERNGTALDPNNFTHISVNTQSTYTELTLTLQGLEDSGSYVCVTANILGMDKSSKVNITVQGQYNFVRFLN